MWLGSHLPIFALMTSITKPVEFSLPTQYQTKKTSPLAWIVSHVFHYWYLILTLIIGAIGNAAFAAVVPIYVGEAINAVRIDSSAIATIIRYALLIAGTQLLRSILQLGRNFSAEMLGQRLERDIRNELYVSLLGKSMTFHNLQPVGDTMARATNDVREINLMFNPGFNLVVGSANFIIIPIILAPRFHPSLVLVPTLFIISYALSLWQYLKELRPVTDESRASFGSLNTRLAEAIDGIETVKGAAQEPNEVGRFRNNALRYRDASIRQGDIEARFLPLLLLGLAEAGGLFHAILLYSRGLIDVGQVVAYFGLIQLFGFPTFVSLFSYSQVSLGMASAKRILELINRVNHLDQNKTGYQQPMRGEIEFRDVSFSYQGEENILQNISFKVHPGQTVAIVGQTGSGKTTLVKLINRTYDATLGKILVDGVDVRDWSLNALRKNISIIEQDVFLFSRSIQENISFGKKDSSHEEVFYVAKEAQADEFITNLEDGYHTVIGERGVTLSGGQRQRLALARAFLTDPRILILDDSTSSIDSATEDKIQRAIYAASRGRTTLIITHRLSQIRWADIILVLRKGEIIAQGSHNDLMDTSSDYRRIFNE